MEEFEGMIGENAFVEHAKFGGNRYGTSKKMIGEITAGGRVVVLDIEMEVCSPSPYCYFALKMGDYVLMSGKKQGVKQIKQSHIAARFVFISPPSMEILEQRLRGRGTEKEESIQKRLTQAKNELEYAQTPGAHDIIIVNDDLEKAYQELEAFIFKEKTQEQSAKDGSKAGESVQD
jgi:guanylate kinase